MAGSPVLVGALTTLVVIVAVFLSYNANQGLPFVPTYDLNAKLPNSAQLVKGNEVRMGGFRVGVITEIKPVRQANGTSYAEVQMKLQKDIEPLPVDSQLVVRPRSALGLKYIQITQGGSEAGFQAGDTLPLSAANPRPVEFDEVLNMFDAPTRTGQKRILDGLGNGLAGRGQDLNETIALLPPLLSNLQPVAANLADPRTRLDRFLPSIARAAAEAAPVAQEQADLFANLDTTFAALSAVARPYIQETITKSPPTLDTAISNFPQQRPFLRNTAGLMRELRPGVAVLPSTLPDLADALELGTPALRRVAGAEQAARGRLHRARGVLHRSARAARHPPPARHGQVALPDAALPAARADHLQLRHALVPQRVERAVGGRRLRHLAAVHHRRHAAGPEQRERAVVGAPRTARRPRTSCAPTRTRGRRRRASRSPAPRATRTSRATSRRSTTRTRGIRPPRPTGRRP